MSDLNIEKVLMVLLENDIIEETHGIQKREHVNTLEDVVSDLILEYKSLANEDDLKNKPALHKQNVRVMCPKCNQPYITYTSDEYYECNSCDHTWI